MKVGDLVKIINCKKQLTFPLFPCDCFWCAGNSNRIGVILGPAPKNSWNVMFDCGECCINIHDMAQGSVVVINETG